MVFFHQNGLGSFLRLLRLLKFSKIRSRLILIRRTLAKTGKFDKAWSLIIVYLLVLHWAACIMFAISLFEFEEGDTHHNLFSFVEEESIPRVDLAHLNIYKKYIYFLYWSSETTGAPNEDVSAFSFKEKVFQLFMILFMKIYISFLTAELVQLLSAQKANYLRHVHQVILFYFFYLQLFH